MRKLDGQSTAFPRYKIEARPGSSLGLSPSRQKADGFDDSVLCRSLVPPWQVMPERLRLIVPNLLAGDSGD